MVAAHCYLMVVVEPKRERRAVEMVGEGRGGRGGRKMGTLVKDLGRRVSCGQGKELKLK